MGTCEHIAQATDVEAQTLEGCEECLAMGSRWVHLRKCLTCGHIGCCDSSPNRHATAHYKETGHPVIASFEPGEEWRWCYVDNVLG
ncbi:UBP-type zinc finger domain-containing protein [Streptosporangiaceae bacterium NEAU-GS5]|nr:UBP-type zinc finger domain-containing protein [Streptosporangiaceae bacterium NEAU-GS5]